MPFIHFFNLQVQPVLQADFVLKAGLLVIILCGVIIYLTVLYRHKKNIMYAERRLQEQYFNEEFLKSRVEVQEATFTSVGTELHDNVGQLLSTAMMLVNMTERELGKASPALTTASETIDKAILELRSLSKSLNKDWIEQFDLEQNLEAEVIRLNTTGEIKVLVESAEEYIPLLPKQQFLLFRIVQEAIQNVVRHSGASLLTINISLKKNIVKGNSLEIRLTDNGRGFDLAAETAGLGMTHMRQRAKSLNASIQWLSNTEGTVVIISLAI